MRLLLLYLVFLFVAYPVFSQNTGIGVGTSDPHPSAELEVSSADKGFLPPRLTFSQRNSITNPAQGLMVYCTDCDSSGQAQIYNGNKWTNLLGGPALKPLPTFLSSITIGTQDWSLKNLDVTTYRNGDIIPQVTDPAQWANLTTGAWCWYNNDSASYAATYGRLYNWYAVNDSRGLAPQGWRVPTQTDWHKLIMFIDLNADTVCGGCAQSDYAGGAMKEASLSYWLIPNGDANNSSEFTGLPGGNRSASGFFYGLTYSGYFWSASECINTFPCAWFFNLEHHHGMIGKSIGAKSAGHSVRVIMD